MSNESFALSTTPEALIALPIGTALAESDKAVCWSYGQIFHKKSKDSEDSQDIAAAKAWRLLGQLSQVMMQEHNPNEPFRPIAETSEGRSLLPCDLDAQTAEAVRQLGIVVDDPELKSKLLDITWDRLRDADSARGAVRGYLESANKLFDPEKWTEYAERTERALRLAIQLGDQELSEVVLGEMERRVIELDGTDPLYLTARLMKLLHEFGSGDAERMIEISTRAAKLAEDANDFYRARRHYRNLGRWRRMAGDKDGERDAKVAIARSYERQAALHSTEGGELQVANLLEKAHQAYRNIGGMGAKVGEVYTLLREAQQRARDAFQEIRTESVDLSNVIEAARNHVAGKPFSEALIALATVAWPTDFERESKTAQELAIRFPLQGLMGGVKVDRDGRVVAHRTAAIGGDENQAEQAHWERIVEQVSMSYQITAQAQIVPAINQFMFEHSPQLRDLHELVLDNPFIPEGHEELFARGFIAGLRWNFPEALSILIPQLENSLRHLLASAGAEITRRDKLGIQSVIQMGAILSDRKEVLESILGSNIVKELKVLFGDQHGPDLRNSVAHGLLSSSDFFGGSAVYAWWLILFLCINPVASRLREQS